MTEEQAGRLIERLDNVKQTVDKISFTIHGNGALGLKAKVENHEATLDNVRKGFWIIFTALVGIIITGVVL